MIMKYIERITPKKCQALITLMSVLLLHMNIFQVTGDNNENEKFIKFFDSYDYIGNVESYSLMKFINFDGDHKLKDILSKMSLKQIKSILLPKGAVALIYSTKELEKKADNTSPLRMIFSSDNPKAPYWTGDLNSIDGGFSVYYEMETCDVPCSKIGGRCLVDEEGNPKCICANGYTGASCGECKSGRYGLSCKICNSYFSNPTCGDKCTIEENSFLYRWRCNDGINGDGKDVCEKGYVIESNCSMCTKGYRNTFEGNCIRCECGEYGICKDFDDKCYCVHGHTTLNINNPCGSCVIGTYMTAAGCGACSEGCKSCDDNNEKCLACYEGYQPDPNDMSKCIITEENKNRCLVGQYLDNNVCKPCPNGCSECYDTNRCYKCLNEDEIPLAIPHEYGTKCAKVDKSDSLLRCMVKSNNNTNNSNQLNSNSNDNRMESIGIFNAQKNVCEICASGCKNCQINMNFSSDVTDENYTSKLLESSICTACEDGYDLFNINGKDICMKETCNLDEVRLSDGKCAQKNVEEPFFGTVLDLWKPEIEKLKNTICKSHTYLTVSGTCLPCHPDCDTCNGPYINSCVSCPKNSFLRNDGTCEIYCPRGYFANSETRKCEKCSSMCEICKNKSQCLVCKNDFTLKKGACHKSNEIFEEENSSISLVKWMGYTFLSICAVTGITTLTVKLLRARKIKCMEKYENWSQCTADARIFNLVKNGDLNNIGINTEEFVNLKINNGV